MSIRNPLPIRRHLGLTSGQWHFVGGLAAVGITAALVVGFVATLLMSGAGQCPADTGRVPSRTLDGRTVCVLPSEAR